MLRSFGAFFLTVALLAFVAACGDADPVVIATVGDYHPFNFINDEERDRRPRARAGRRALRAPGLECEWVLHEWETLIPDLMAEQFDVILRCSARVGNRVRLPVSL